MGTVSDARRQGRKAAFARATKDDARMMNPYTSARSWGADMAATAWAEAFLAEAARLTEEVATQPAEDPNAPWRGKGLRHPGDTYVDSRTGLDRWSASEADRIKNLRELEGIGLMEAKRVVRYEDLIREVASAETVEDLKTILINHFTERKDGRP